MDSNRGSKKVKASSSSSPAINLPDNDDDQQQAAALPHPPHRLHVSYLPDIAHDAITACLTMDDMHRMMETSPWGLATYGGRVKEVKIPHHFMGHTHRALAISLLQRRPALLRFNALNPLEVEALGEAMKSQQFSRLQTLEISLHGNFPQEGRSCFTSLFEGLAGGACPKLNNIRLDLRWEEEKQSEGDAVLASLGAALQSRMRGGGSCCGLKRLEIFGRCLTDLSSVLSSGACEGLEDLLLASLERSIVGDKTYEAVTEWIMRTKAINLRLFTLLVNGPLLPPAMGSALSSPGVAPKLRTLNVAVVAGAFLTHITTAIQRGAWPELKNIMVAPDHDISSDALSCLMEAICVGASELRTLALLDAGVKEDGARAMARAISKGACPRLEALDLVSTTIGDGGVMELSRAFKVGALCNTTLRRLSLQDCDISPHGLAELSADMVDGALPNLEHLDLSDNRVGDAGVVPLVRAMASGRLQQLKDLNLESVSLGDMAVASLNNVLGNINLCPNLHRLCLLHNPNIRKGVMMQLLQRTDQVRGVGKVSIRVNLDRLRDGDEEEVGGH